MPYIDGLKSFQLNVTTIVPHLPSSLCSLRKANCRIILNETVLYTLTH